MIRRIRIRNYKSLKDVEVTLQPISIIMGPNAAGKSNFFDALSLLSQTATSPTLVQAFGSHRGLPLESVHGWPHSRGKSNVGYGDISFDVDVQLSDSVTDYVNKRIRDTRQPFEGSPSMGYTGTLVRERNLRYQLTLRVDYESGHIGLLDERAVALTRDSSRERMRGAFLERASNRIHLRMEGQAHPRYFDVGIDHTVLSAPFYWPHHPHLAALQEEFRRWRFFYLEPKTLMRAANPVQETTVIGPQGENLAAFYNTLLARNERQYGSVLRSISQIIPGLQNIEIDRTPDGLLLLTVVESTGVVSSRLVSEGTLRILGLAAIMNSLLPNSVVGYEEPENGVHPRRLALLAEWFKNEAQAGQTQWIINTHSPLLAREFEARALYVCRRPGRESSIMPFTSLGPIFKEGEIDRALEGRILRGDLAG